MDATNIISQLVSQLGITQQQAQGGAGLLLKFAKDELGDADFTKVTQFIPNSDALIAQVPQASGMGGVLGGLASSVGGLFGAKVGTEVADLANLASGFSALGLDRDQIAPFVSSIVAFVEKQGGAQVAALLQNAMKV